jgi:regulator of replication initiation timing
MVQQLYTQVSTLSETVESLTDTVEKTTQQNEQLVEVVETLKKKVTTLEDENNALQSELADVRETATDAREFKTSAHSRMNVINDELESLESELTDIAFKSEDDVAEVRRRVAGIEDELGLEDWGTTVGSSHPNACLLEQYSSLPADKRDEELRAPQARATIVWENFDEWSSPTHRGRIIRSGELRKLLKAQLGKKLAWNQVYRVMEEFELGTTAQYKYIEDESDDGYSSVGKALIRLKDF